MGAELSLRGVRQVRGGREVLAVDSLDIASGERVCVLGPNGAGKTTLMRLLAAVDSPQAGAVAVDGVSTGRGGVEQRRRVAYATQRPGLLSTSVRRNVELPLRWRKVPRARRHDLADDALDRLRVGHLAARPAGSLSGGERQRVNLARALALDPAVLLLDEPAASLDAATRASFFADLERALEDRATTVVHVSHRSEEALRLADRVVVLVGGRVHQTGTPEELNRRPADASVAAVVGYDNIVDAFVDPGGSVLVGRAATGLSSQRVGGVSVAVFAGGVRILDGDRDGDAGVPVRVTRITPGPGHRSVALEGAASLRAHVPVDVPLPSVGEQVAVGLDPALSVVLPAANAPGNDSEPGTAPGTATASA